MRTKCNFPYELYFEALYEFLFWEKKVEKEKYTIYSYFFHAFLERRGFLYTCAVNLIFFRCNFTLRYDCANKKWCHDFKVFIFYVINVEFQKGCPRLGCELRFEFPFVFFCFSRILNKGTFTFVINAFSIF